MKGARPRPCRRAPFLGCIQVEWRAGTCASCLHPSNGRSVNAHTNFTALSLLAIIRHLTQFLYQDCKMGEHGEIFGYQASAMIFVWARNRIHSGAI
jgi:hypothetical protein